MKRKQTYYACPDLLGKVLCYVVTQEGPGKEAGEMGHGFDSQNSQVSSQPPVTTVPRDLAPSSDFVGTRYTYDIQAYT